MRVSQYVPSFQITESLIESSSISHFINIVRSFRFVFASYRIVSFVSYRIVSYHFVSYRTDRIVPYRIVSFRFLHNDSMIIVAICLSINPMS